MPLSKQTNSTPNHRLTRSNSNSNTNFTLDDIKELIDKSRDEILNAFDQKCDKLHELVAGLGKRVDELDLKFRNLEHQCHSEIENMKHSMSTRSFESNQKPNEHLIEEILEEVRQRQMRTKYVILSGVAEKLEGALEERRSADIESIKMLTKEIDCNIQFSNVQRVGRSNLKKSRLLKFKCETEEDRNLLLTNARKLRKSE